MKRKKAVDIVVEIRGGVAHVAMLPKGMRLAVIDYDTEGASPEDVDVAPDGTECFVSVYESQYFPTSIERPFMKWIEQTRVVTA